jgi:hypothetical protein
MLRDELYIIFTNHNSIIYVIHYKNSNNINVFKFSF